MTIEETEAPLATVLDSPNTAILALDFQADFLQPNGRMPVAQWQIEPCVEAYTILIEHAKTQNIPIIQVGNEFKKSDWLMNTMRNNASIEGSPGVAWDDRFAVTSDNLVYFPKWNESAFVNPDLHAWMKERDIKTIVLCGLKASNCLASTARAAMKLGYRVFVPDEITLDSSDYFRKNALRSLHSYGVGKLIMPEVSSQEQAVTASQEQEVTASA